MRLGKDMRTVFWKVAVILGMALTTAAAGAPARVDVQRAAEVDLGPYVASLREHAKSPIEYLVGKFQTSDLVILGEEHGIRENCRFVASSLQPLYEQAGVRVLATEFLRSSNTRRVNQLVTGEAFDRKLALDLMRDYAWPTWGYAEYLEILTAVWRLNAALPPDAQRMRVVPLDSDWSQHALFYTQTDPLERFNTMRKRERHMTRVLRNEVLAPGHKAIVHIGFQHSVLTFGERVAAVLHRQYGDRVWQVCLHHKFSDPRGASEVSRLIDLAWREYAGGPIGFDTQGTPFAVVRDPGNPAFTFGGDRTLGQLATGYIVFAPLAELHPVSWIDGFITAENFHEALEVAVKMGQADAARETTPEKLNDRLKRELAARK